MLTWKKKVPLLRDAVIASGSNLIQLILWEW